VICWRALSKDPLSFTGSKPKIRKCSGDHRYSGGFGHPSPLPVWVSLCPSPGRPRSAAFRLDPRTIEAGSDRHHAIGEIVRELNEMDRVCAVKLCAAPAVESERAEHRAIPH